MTAVHQPLDALTLGSLQALTLASRPDAEAIAPLPHAQRVWTSGIALTALIFKVIRLFPWMVGYLRQ
jgi:hypothetical protein